MFLRGFESSLYPAIMFGTTLLVDVPLEDRESANHMKKLCTAVSIEAPDLFRIHGVPCIDRGPDRLRPPVVYEHWNGSRDSSSSKKHDNGGGGEDCVLKKTANFARPSSVSADTPNFFKVRDTNEIHRVHFKSSRKLAFPDEQI